LLLTIDEIIAALPHIIIIQNIINAALDVNTSIVKNVLYWTKRKNHL